MKTKDWEAERYDPREERSNALSHWLGALLGAIGLSVLLFCAIRNRSVAQIVSFSIYGGSFILMYIASASYHSVQAPRIRKLLRVADHSAIFLFIAGTYMPIAILSLRGGLRVGISCAVWGIAVFGVVFKILTAKRLSSTKNVSLFLYLALGWLALLIVRPIVETVGIQFLLFLLAGGLLYSAGTVFYAKRTLRFHHAIWHLFVLAASVVHYIGILDAYALP
ncbi:hemolysin [Aedoeadaptatus ivorii]|uniref:Hemolysin n=1 Tax=Aedoeadaptatus ivorii TaxID=54006 RepID=A0A448UZQ1_9FIRM|nr:hemolysin III family protein [Peptoniphilus ivorii]VEJ34305.1 hemolysin [Peptoniphilus ivorii]